MSQTESPPPPPSLDARLPPEMADRAESAGVAKAALDPWKMLALAVMAGAFIAFGAIFSTVVAADSATLPFGVARLLIGLSFSLGLILVVVGGAELFTGDVLMVMAWASGKLGLPKMLKAWALVYLGNLVGALGTALLTFGAGHYLFGGAKVGLAALAIANAKSAEPFLQALLLGVLCNVLVCMAVWACFAARSAADKVLVIVLPIAAFVAAGFEHSIANMYYLPEALLIQSFAPDAFWQQIAKLPTDSPTLSLANALANLAAVTLGNMIGGGALVAGMYWFIYLRSRRP
ncbi:formate/nitrite transporter family protein [Dongia sedimenti]|uniref:Formate/nitrite transporter family protein n=1 Tax=Dongia sedimenti TaxID=3064282 RepID=A0ABU0YJA5_9PROT|nr:formate/nitrite transporter family protein [Rhodospirillaceae bacterium R-7]